MQDIIDGINFLEDVSNEYNKELGLFKNLLKVFRVKDCPDITFKISSDWNGKWLAGKWYYKEKRISSPDELMQLLTRNDNVDIMFNFDVIEDISSWSSEKYTKVI